MHQLQDAVVTLYMHDFVHWFVVLAFDWISVHWIAEQQLPAQVAVHWFSEQQLPVDFAFDWHQQHVPVVRIIAELKLPDPSSVQ